MKALCWEGVEDIRYETVPDPKIEEITAIDLICAQTLTADAGRKRSRIPDYSNRTGFPKIAAQIRGAAAKDFRTSADMRTAPVSAGGPR